MVRKVLAIPVGMAVLFVVVLGLQSVAAMIHPLPEGLDPTQADWEAGLATWLADPPTVKPGSFMPNLGLTAEEIDALVAYLGSLK